MNELRGVFLPLLLNKKILVGTAIAGIIAVLLMSTLGFLLILSSSDSGTSEFEAGTANVSPEVMALSPIVEKYARENGIPEYVGLILALIMQESGGTPQALKTDPMQSSESLCGRVGCINDVDASIKQGVKHFKSVLENSGYDVLLTLQSYNFGGGFIGWVKKHGGKYTKELAIQFSQEQYAKEVARGRGHLYSCPRAEAKPLKACYGDILYVDAVLKYFNGSVGGVVGGGGGGMVVNASGASKKAIEAGMTLLGRPYFWGGGRTTKSIARKEFDCSSFVRWAYEQAGVNLGPMSGTTTDTLKHKGRKISLSEMKPGDLMFWNTYKINGHVGIYIGDGQFIGAQSSTGISIVSIDKPYYKKRFNHVRRVVE